MKGNNGIIFIALGSAIVILGVVMYFLQILGAIGMLIFGILVEVYGIYYFWKNRFNKN